MSLALCAAAAATILVVWSCRAFTTLFLQRNADRVILDLKLGNLRFVNNEPRALPMPEVSRREVAEDQEGPVAVVVCCSGCPMPVEDIFSQPPGRLYVIATAGNTAGVQSVGSMQHGLTRYHIPVIVVLGHTNCAVVKNAFDRRRGEGNLDRMLDQVRQAEGRLDRPVKELADPLRSMSIANVRHAAETFLKADPWLAAQVDKGVIRLLEGLYDDETGEVEWLPDE